ncbi:MAG TPA: hypothetical protein VG168_15250 [Bryobacteraceae bacterium]|nr:hypothetical protein [Bryobacteraceae bacterium]
MRIRPKQADQFFACHQFARATEQNFKNTERLTLQPHPDSTLPQLPASKIDVVIMKAKSSPGHIYRTLTGATYFACRFLTFS